MNRTSVSTNIIYFGKIPSRGDFVKSSGSIQLITTLDTWLAQTMELLSADPRWKIMYDEARPINFAFFGSRSRLVLSAHLALSRDSSQRRFPFITASTFEVEQPLAFMAHSPLILSRLWTRFETFTSNAIHAQEDASEILQMGVQTPVIVEPSGAYTASFRDFTEAQTLGTLEATINQAGHTCSVRRSVLALGTLLQPLLTNSASNLQKGLLLPLPADPLYRYFVASFWLDLIAQFLVRGDFEVGIFTANIDNKPGLVVSFNGASAKTLHGLIDPVVGHEQNVSISDSEWVEDYIEGNYAIKKLSSYMQQPQLSLRQTGETFREVFLGL